VITQKRGAVLCSESYAPSLMFWALYFGSYVPSLIFWVLCPESYVLGLMSRVLCFGPYMFKVLSLKSCIPGLIFHALYPNRVQFIKELENSFDKGVKINGSNV